MTNNEITLLRVQCLLILGLYECTEGKENQGWLKIGYAIRMVQVLRLGELSFEKGVAKGLAKVERG